MDPINPVGKLEAEKLAQTNALVAAMPFNVTKTSEHGFENGTAPLPGGTVVPESWMVTASTLSEVIVSGEVGTQAQKGFSPGNESLDRVRVDSSGQHLNTIRE